MNKRLTNFLDKQKAKYKLIKHKTVYTAYDAAATQGLKLKQVAKTLLIKADNKFIFAILPASKRLDLNKLKKEMNRRQKKLGEKVTKKITICNERQIVKNFTKGKGALAPFGSFYKTPTFIDKGLMKAKKINLNAGTFTESLEMTPAMYKKVEKPVEGVIGK
ncbi:MAG: YbaK/EbsC family protein [Patescibacteria group bacterium]